MDSALTTGVSKEVSADIKNFTDQARRPEAELEKDLSKNIGMGGFLQGQDLPSRNVMTNKDLLDAIEKRGLRGFRAESAALSSQIKSQALQMRMSKMNQAAQLVNAEHQQNERARMNKYIMNQNRKRARAQTLGNILGIAGAAGGAMVGGPAGAMAGYQLGQGVGQAGGME
jgi:hypothetical protein